MIIGVEALFDEHIKNRFKTRPAVVGFLVGHERKSRVINNICEQINLAEASNIKNKFDARRFKQLIGAGADLFARAALEQLEHKMMTQAEKQRRIDEYNRTEEAKELLTDLDDAK